MGYKVIFDNLGTPEICGAVQRDFKRMLVNTVGGPQCNAHNVVAHELGHVLDQVSVRAGDRNRFLSFLPAGQSASTICSYDLNDTIQFYNNSFCEMWSDAAALTFGVTIPRSAGSNTITNDMVNQVSKEFLSVLYPQYSCRVAMHYRIFFNRNPDTQGFGYWSDQIWAHNYNLDYIPTQFFNGAEYNNSGNVKSMNDWNFARHMIKQVFNRNPTSWQEQDYWRDQAIFVGRPEAARRMVTNGRCSTNAAANAYVANF